MKNLFKKLALIILGTTICSVPVHAHKTDDPLLARVMINQLEWRNSDEIDPYMLEIEAWIGYDLRKIWFKSDIEFVDAEVEEAEVQVLYNHAVTPFWDFQAGLRHDFKPGPERQWGVIGIHGLAPYYIEIEAALFIGESGDSAAHLSAEYELMFTQKLVLSPEISVDLHGQNNDLWLEGSGISDVEAGLRLSYEIRREFAPYVGLNWSKSFGNTANYIRNQGESISETQWVAGVRAWF